jgi:sarcosine oxidase / L-pipecolate oxidase
MEANETETSYKKQKVLIVGAGCFGLSTAYYLLDGNDRESTMITSTPRYTVTIIDSSPTVPAPDAASSDINKIVRSTYADGFYTRLAREAVVLWKEGTTCGKENYHE